MVTFKNILDRVYRTLFTDYKLDKLVETDEQAFYDYLGGFLVNATDYFDSCFTDLSYHPVTEVIEKDNQFVTVTNYVFDNELTSKEQYILSLGVALGWYKKQLDDVTQFRLHLSNKDFKSYSEQQNLQRRLERLGAMEEDLSEEITKYQLANLDKLPYFGGA
jgi:hypothetical protein